MSNILPYNDRAYIRRIRLLRLATVTLWALVLLTLTAAVLLIPKLVMVNSHYAIAQGEVSQLEQAGMATSPVDINALDKQVSLLAAKLSAAPVASPIAYIDSVRSVATAGITLSGYSIDTTAAAAPTLEIAGTASTREALQAYVAKLEQANGVVSVDSPVSNYVKSTGSQFNITVTFKKP